MSVQMVLFEHASGYGLFKVKEFEEISALTSQVEASVNDPSKFNSVCSIIAFYPFKNAAEALANINAVSEGIPTDELKNFVQVNLPNKAKKCTMGVQDPKLGGVLSEELGCKVRCMKIVFVLYILKM